MATYRLNPKPDGTVDVTSTLEVGGRVFHRQTVTAKDLRDVPAVVGSLADVARTKRIEFGLVQVDPSEPGVTQ